jgi:hypothetical protein
MDVSANSSASSLPMVAYLQRKDQSDLRDVLRLWFSPFFLMAGSNKMGHFLWQSVRKNFTSSVELFFLPILPFIKDLIQLVKMISEIPVHVGRAITSWIVRN